MTDLDALVRATPAWPLAAAIKTLRRVKHNFLKDVFYKAIVRAIEETRAGERIADHVKAIVKHESEVAVERRAKAVDDSSKRKK